MNVLIYNGPGTTPGSVKHVVDSLRLFLEPYYAVSTVSAKVLETEPWMTKTAAVVFPGGADLPYVKECKPIIPLLKHFVSKEGGIYIGFCAGAYFGSSRVEFCVGNPTMEVSSNRDLQFFKGIARGPAFNGFQYHSEAGARPAKLRLQDGSVFSTYFNGGPVFVDADHYENVEVLAHYAEKVDTPYSDNGKGGEPAASILCTVGTGKALLVGAHPEFVPSVLEKSEDKKFVSSVVSILKKNETKRLEFMRYILSKATLKCNSTLQNAKLPDLTPILAIASPHNKNLIGQWKDNLKNITDKELPTENQVNFKDENDNFELYNGFTNYDLATRPLVNKDVNADVKTIIVPTQDELFPPPALTPSFDISKYFATLSPANTLGSFLLYGEVVTSTSELLNTNKSLLSSLPENTVLHIGSLQISGRGRSGNSWVNPKGVSASTAVVSLPLQSPTTGDNISVVFVQYLSMLAYCEAIANYSPGYEDLPVRIKWPNDLYALKPDYYYEKKMSLLGKSFDPSLVPLTDIDPAYAKIAGLLVNTNFINNKYSLLIGCGLNVTNSEPTTSLKQWVDILNEERRVNGLPALPNIEVEILLAKYMNNLEVLLKQFIDRGAAIILPQYYNLWLHSEQIVTLTSLGNIRAKISGITPDYGLLIAKELVSGSDSDFTGNVYHLQPDGNTFDIFKGLIAQKAI
ncbi:biotin--[acetyl-CoA-carboxylase] ligase BPL1 NDAI_0A02120 [Naumovozyma dairenensis CBS 421]|uniref:BPL/LPL catalytic domain-containing protein n=1 Tax=Naumovozyma dairenensis (strain ATCC 10597 / BCRC 20456 / CBS 421 / NBRC 0211 / NRRL Y-12639) TaxID=1071378 RepID=G0W3I2_NAUDC|nr:hypothetical protein NDAI_0A02120 [Naumovozyma dairenensis CBS 421]CCD22370.1 hypothetical protein NDAI_0A02120 [Naumovozyma dairenensis CBS 421]